MVKIGLLKNKIYEYAWGSHTAIPNLLGKKKPSLKPQAELWMGTHSLGASRVQQNGDWVSLDVLVKKNPIDTLGERTAKKFHNRLPFLFKVLAAKNPLSIQAHPNLSQAQKGFATETQLGIPIKSFNRNYKDNNHKPECICALTSFWALNGFRNVSSIFKLMSLFCGASLKKEMSVLENSKNRDGLKVLFKKLMNMKEDKKSYSIQNAVNKAREKINESDISRWIIKLHQKFPKDIGILSPLFLNLVELKPGHAMYLPSGELHAYLLGTGMELMANSDNVLRGGLTSKYVDVDALLKILNFKERKINILKPEKLSGCEYGYSTPSEEFLLSLILLKKDNSYFSTTIRSGEIMLCMKGFAKIIQFPTGEQTKLIQGSSVFIPAAVKKYQIDGDAVIYKASVPQ